jgi:hypothetical protein
MASQSFSFITLSINFIHTHFLSLPSPFPHMAKEEKSFFQKEMKSDQDIINFGLV